MNVRRIMVLALSALSAVACSDDPSTATENAADTAPTGVGDEGGAQDSGGGGDASAPTTPPVPGLRAEYFADFLDLQTNTVEPTIDHDWGAAAKTHFSVRWTGTLTAPKSSQYTVATQSDDGIRVWIDGKLVIDDWSVHSVTHDQAQIDLQANLPVAIRVEYFQWEGGATARLLWSSSDFAEQVVPTANLLAAATASGLPGPKPPYANPVVPFDCPDPGVLATTASNGPLYAMVCTGGTFPIRTSRSLVLWTDSGDALLPGGQPPWAANGLRNWAPEIHAVGNDLVAYFTSVNAANVLSVGAVHTSNILGSYTDRGGPLVEDPEGVIDPTFFEDDDGSRWLLYKIDGNASSHPTPILLRQLAADGLSFAPGSSPVTLLMNDPSTWEGGVIEGPWLVKRSGTYYLFYSGNVYDSRYRTGVARASALAGPYTKHGPPILSNNAAWVGPGHGSVVPVGSLDYYVYHAWRNAGDGTQLDAEGRQVLVDRIVWTNGWPALSDGTPSTTPQPWPGTEGP
jgi:GH43 family beta-xylosidase